MKNNTSYTLIIVLALTVTAAFPTAIPAAEGQISAGITFVAFPPGVQDIPFSQVPDPVQHTITSNLNGGKINVVTRETRDDKTLFAAYLQTKENKTIKLNTSDDGKVLGVDSLQ